MKFVLLLSIATATLVAQNAPEGARVPREPSTGIAKSFEPLPIKNGVATATDLIVPCAPVARPRRAIPGADSALGQALADAVRAFADPDFVAIDDGDTETTWVVGSGYKAAFEAGSWQFIGRPAADAPELQPIDFRLARVRVGGQAIELRDATRSREGHRFEYDRGGVREAIEVAGRGVEQMFVFDQLPQRGELVVDIAVGTALRTAVDAGGVRFTGEFDDVRYSAAVAIDANGDRVAAPISLADGQLTIRVPEEFMARAVLPLCIDPWVTAAPVFLSSVDLGEPDIAWDETGQLWAISFMRLFGAADWDCYVQRLSYGNPMQPIGGLTTIDGSTAAWVQPRIADLSVHAGLMVVCQTRSGSNPWNISGRIMANSGPTITPQFVIASSAVDELHPDIGADSGAPPAYFTVVWEHAYASNDHDIYARQIDITGALRGLNPIYVQTNTGNQSWPSISKSAGGGFGVSRRFAIVYQQTFSAWDEDIYAATMTWDGVLVPTNAGINFPLSIQASNEIRPQVCSPTLPDLGGNRAMLAVFEKTNIDNGDIGATCFDLDGTVRANVNMSMMEQDPVRLMWPQYRPSVSSDGRRFVVGYHEQHNGNATVNDLDTRVTVLALGLNGLFTEEIGTPMAQSNTNREFNLQITSRYDGSGIASPSFNTVNDRDGISVGFGIDAYSFDLVPFGRLTTRSNGCGALAISALGHAIPGGLLGITLGGQQNLGGFVVGLPATIPVGPCATCTLGVDGFSLFGTSCSIPVPNNPAIVGWQFAVQGFSFVPSGAPCLGQIRFSDTIDFTIG
jgi:hypothetical protein